eukprot:5932188-Pleurochrysis_carterae.AAC.1
MGDPQPHTPEILWARTSEPEGAIGPCAPRAEARTLAREHSSALATRHRASKLRARARRACLS